MNQQMIGKSWLEWENDLPNDSDSAEEEFLEYRQTVKKETPQLTIDHDIKSEVCPEIPDYRWAHNGWFQTFIFYKSKFSKIFLTRLFRIENEQEK